MIMPYTTIWVDDTNHHKSTTFHHINSMSRRASVFARQNPGKRRVRFPDEVIFENEIKEQDGEAVMTMLRRASIDIDINRINSAGKSYLLMLL